MKILFFSWEYPPNGSGIGRYVAEMAAALRGKGHDTVVVTSLAPGQAEREEGDAGVVYRVFDRCDLRHRAVAERILEIAQRHQVDWIEGADHWGECAALLRLRNRPPVVVKMHYNDVLRTSRYAQAWYPWLRVMIDMACWRQWRSIGAERASLATADVLLACSQRSLLEARRQGLRLSRRTAVIPNPIQPLPVWQNAEARHPALLLVGRLDVGKGLPHLRPMLERLLPFHPTLTVEIAGGDSFARGLGSIREWFLRQLGPMQAQVRLLGVLNAGAMDDAYRRAWAVIVPSRWDTFPQVVLEAMVRGKPIVASPHGGMPEMLAGTDNAVADPAGGEFAEAIRRLLDDPVLRRRHGAQVKTRAETVYAPAVVADAYIQTVMSCLGNSLRSPAAQETVSP